MQIIDLKDWFRWFYLVVSVWVACEAEASPPELTVSEKRIEVAVGIMCLPTGEMLVQERRQGTDCAGQWEFPGGKQEAGETISAALVREFDEELGVQPTLFTELTVIEHGYDHANVRLHTFLIKGWLGDATPREGQKLKWLQPDRIRHLDLLAAAYPLLGLAEQAISE